MLSIIVLEDNQNLRPALVKGLEATNKIRVMYDGVSGEALINEFQGSENRLGAEVALLDVELAGELDGIQTAVALRREAPRFPVVFYSIQDDDRFYRSFLAARILSHFAYVRKSNFLLPEMILPLLQDAVSGRSYIDPEIESRVQEVRTMEEQDPMALLEPNEQTVARMLAAGLTNEQIAQRLGYRDKRTISRINGQIYTVWGLRDTATDEKIARTRAAMIVQARRLIRWDQAGKAFILDDRGDWAPHELEA